VKKNRVPWLRSPELTQECSIRIVPGSRVQEEHDGNQEALQKIIRGRKSGDPGTTTPVLLNNDLADSDGRYSRENCCKGADELHTALRPRVK
jgi:hypothetical protein